MKLLKKALAPKEVKVAFAALDEAAYEFQNEAFQIVRTIIEKYLLSKPDDLFRVIQKSGGRTPREWVYSQIGNIAGDLLESGQYHIYRGVINPMGPGEDLLKMYDATYDELVQMKAIDPNYAKEQKAALRKNIQSVG